MTDAKNAKQSETCQTWVAKVPTTWQPGHLLYPPTCLWTALEDGRGVLLSHFRLSVLDFAPGPGHEDFAPRDEDFAPRGEDFAPRGEDFAPRGEDFATGPRHEEAVATVVAQHDIPLPSRTGTSFRYDQRPAQGLECHVLKTVTCSDGKGGRDGKGATTERFLICPTDDKDWQEMTVDPQQLSISFRTLSPSVSACLLRGNPTFVAAVDDTVYILSHVRDSDPDRCQLNHSLRMIRLSTSNDRQDVKETQVDVDAHFGNAHSLHVDPTRRLCYIGGDDYIGVFSIHENMPGTLVRQIQLPFVSARYSTALDLDTGLYLVLWEEQDKVDVYTPPALFSRRSKRVSTPVYSFSIPPNPRTFRHVAIVGGKGGKGGKNALIYSNDGIVVRCPFVVSSAPEVTL